MNEWIKRPTDIPAEPLACMSEASKQLLPRLVIGFRMGLIAAKRLSLIMLPHHNTNTGKDRKWNNSHNKISHATMHSS